MEAPKCCGKPMELKAGMGSSSGFGIREEKWGFQCKKCGKCKFIDR